MKQEQIKVNVPEYLWHVSKGQYDKAIALNGIKPQRDRFVYANTENKLVLKMWPICFDFVDDCLCNPNLHEIGELYAEAYTFWRIDTKMISIDWYLDDNINHVELEWYNCHYAEAYVKTPHIIPVEALVPFRYRHETEQKIVENRGNGWFQYHIEESPNFYVDTELESIMSKPKD